MSTENKVDPKDPSSTSMDDRAAFYEKIFAGDATDQEQPGEEPVGTTDQDLLDEQISQLGIAPPESASFKEESNALTVFAMIALVVVIAIGLFFLTRDDVSIPVIADEPPEIEEITAPPTPGAATSRTATPKDATPKPATPASTAKEPKEAKVTKAPEEAPEEVKEPEESKEPEPEGQQTVLKQMTRAELERLKEIEMETMRNHETASEYYRRGDYANALPLYQKAQGDFESLRSQYKQFAESEYNDVTMVQKALAAIYNAIGDINRNQKKYTEALSLFNKSLEIRKKVYGENHSETAAIYNNIALVYSAQGKYALALEWYRKDLAISEKALGSDHPDTAKTYNNIGMAYFHLRERNNALEWFRKALAIQEKDQGDKNPNAAMTYNNIAEVYRTQGDYALALPEYIKAYRILLDSFGEGHSTTKAVRLNMSRAYEKSNNPKPFDDWLSEEMN